MFDKNIFIEKVAFCPHCNMGDSSLLDEECTINYFYGNKIVCNNCSNEIDSWGLISHQLVSVFPSISYHVLGGSTQIFQIEIKPNQVMLLDLENWGIPSDAKILFINYTAQGFGVHPIELHGNTVQRNFIPHKIYLFGRLLDDNYCEKTSVAVLVTWIKNVDDDSTLDNLVYAFESMNHDNFESMIIPANVAVESVLQQLVFNYLRSFSSEGRIKNFLLNGATYSHQLNVLLPLISTNNKLPILNEKIRGNLNKLNKQRNKIAHEGKLPTDLDKTAAVDLLCAAFLGYEYIKFVQNRITE